MAMRGKGYCGTILPDNIGMAPGHSRRGYMRTVVPEGMPEQLMQELAGARRYTWGFAAGFSLNVADGYAPGIIVGMMAKIWGNVSDISWAFNSDPDIIFISTTQHMSGGALGWWDRRAGIMAFNSSVHWSSIMLNDVAGHEHGHAMGLGHDPDRKALMYYQALAYEGFMSPGEIDWAQRKNGKPRGGPYPVNMDSTRPEPGEHEGKIVVDFRYSCTEGSEHQQIMNGKVIAELGQFAGWEGSRSVSFEIPDVPGTYDVGVRLHCRGHRKADKTVRYIVKEKPPTLTINKFTVTDSKAPGSALATFTVTGRCKVQAKLNGNVVQTRDAWENQTWIQRWNDLPVGTNTLDLQVVGSAHYERNIAIIVPEIEPEPGDGWQNPKNKFDVNDDGVVSPVDALLVINYLNSGAPSVPTSPAPPYLDVNGDGRISPVDALLVINQLNSKMELEELANQIFGTLAGGPQPWIYECDAESLQAALINHVLSLEGELE